MLHYLAVEPETRAGNHPPHRERSGVNALIRLGGFLRPYRLDLAAAIVATVLRALSQVLALYYAKEVFSVDVSGELGPAFEALTRATLLVLAISTAGAVFYFASVYFWNRMANKAVRDIRNRMFGHLNVLGMPFYDRTRTGDTASRLVNDTQLLQQIVVHDMRDMLAAPVTILAGFVGMIALSWRLTLAGAIVAPLVVMVMGGLGRRIRRITQSLQESTARLAGLLSESVSGVRVVRAFCLEQHESQRFETEDQELYRNTMRSTRVSSVLLPVCEWLATFGFCAIVWVGMGEIIRERLEMGALIAFALLMQRVGSSFSRAGRNWARVQEMGAVSDRIFELLDEPTEEREPEDLPELEVTTGHVVFEAVTFGYEPGLPVLRGVSFEIPPGQVVAVVGESGSGKSTLASLLVRLYEPTAGRILVDGTPIATCTRASLRRALGVVLQESFLFTGTIAQNIRLGRLDATDSEVREAATVANALGFIEAMPQGFESIVGERGATLSGGQRQRVAVARAVLRNPRILILDEATSSLDSEAEQLVQEALQRLMVGRTTLAIAHRLSTIQRSDVIHVLDDGRIVESGTHAELLALGGQYARMWSLQSGGNATAGELAE